MYRAGGVRPTPGAPLVKSSQPGDPVFADSDSFDQPDELAPFSVRPRRQTPAPPVADPAVLDLLTSDVDLTDLTTLKPSRARKPTKGAAASMSAAVPQRDSPKPAPRTAMPMASVRREVMRDPVPALQISRRPIARDFDEDLATRVRDAEDRDPSLDLSLSDALGEGEAFPAVSEKSVVRRIVKSVVSHLPRAFQSAAEKSGLIDLSGRPKSAPLMTIGARRPRDRHRHARLA